MAFMGRPLIQTQVARVEVFEALLVLGKTELQWNCSVASYCKGSGTSLHCACKIREHIACSKKATFSIGPIHFL